MFKKENRLVPGVSFRNSHLFSTPQILVKEKENGLTINRFGIVVSKKIDKRAVTRNEIKRSLRAIVIDLGRKLYTGHDILLIVKTGLVGKTKEEEKLLIESVFGNAGLIKK